jgi:hypothetical protein
VVAAGVGAVSLSGRRGVVVVVALSVFAGLLVNATQPASPQTASPQAAQTTKGGWAGIPSWLRSGAAGGLLVFVLTTTVGAVVRTRQRGRELRGLSRVLWPEMRRNKLAISNLATGKLGHNTTTRGQGRNKPKADYPTREAWLATRAKLAELMREEDFDALARYYAELEALEVARDRDLATVALSAGKAKNHEDQARRVVEGYCNARWSFGYRPGPTSGDGDGI